MIKEVYAKSSIPEEQLITSLIKGEDKAYRIIYDRYYAYLCVVAREYVKDDFIAETVVGDVIYNIWKIRETLDPNLRLKAYLIRSVRNRSINYLQQEYVQREKSFANDENQSALDDLLYIEEIHPLDNLLEQELHEKINRIVDHFPVECKNVFVRSRFDGKKYDEIADEMKISVNTVKYHIKNALSKLRHGLEEYL